MRKSTAERFWEKVEKTDTCWLWTGAKDSGGYGQIRNAEGVVVKAHRLSLELAARPLPPGGVGSELVTDHLCRVRHCVRPDHLEIVTRQTNTLRGETLAAAQILRTHCPKDHEYDEANTIIQGDGKRRCRECRNMQRRARRSNNTRKV